MELPQIDPNGIFLMKPSEFDNFYPVESFHKKLPKIYEILTMPKKRIDSKLKRHRSQFFSYKS